MASEDEEVARFALLIAERCASLFAEHGKAYFESILIERLRALGAPHTMNALAAIDAPPAPATRDKDQALRDIDDLLVSLAHAHLVERARVEQAHGPVLELLHLRPGHALLHLGRQRAKTPGELLQHERPPFFSLPFVESFESDPVSKRKHGVFNLLAHDGP